MWVPVFLAFVFWEVWLSYIRLDHISRLKWVMLEIKIPREILKSPKAMEAVFTSLHSTYAGTLIDKYWKGFLPSWFSFEIASFNGNVHFYVYTQPFFKNLVESQLYSQYPDIEIKEVEDYTRAIPHRIPNDDWNLWGTEFVLTKDDNYPIKTYVDFGLDKPAEEEEKVDPLAALIEFFGSLKDGEQAWLQILIKGAGSDWHKKGEKIVKDLLGREKFKPHAEEGKGVMLSHGENELLKAVERNISKLGFEAGTRFVYAARKDVFTPMTFSAVLGIIKQFNSPNLNGFKPLNSTGAVYFFPERRAHYKKKIMVDAYRKRSWFYPPFRRKSYVLNAEELATIYHFPGRVSETPTFERVEAKKGAPPPNLPV